MTKAMLRIILGLVIITSCTSGNGSVQVENGINISGTVGFPQTGDILIEEYVGNQPQPFDTLKLDENYKYSKNVNIERPGYYRLNFYNKQFVNLILNEDDVVVNVDGNERGGFVEISGSKDHDFIEMVQQMNAEFQSSPQVAEINNRFGLANSQQDAAAINTIRDEYMELDSEFKKQIAAKIDSAGASLGVIEILKSGRFLDKDQFQDTYHKIAEEAKTELSNSTVAMDFVNEVEASKNLAIGMVAPDIALPNPDGEIVALSSLRGKYVLVDFWAKWCGPCRKENPNVVKAYNRFNAKGFEVYGVSLDRRREDWLQAIEQDGLHWTQVSDLKYWNSEAAKTYNIKAIPFALLLDPDGVIIGKNLRGRELERKLEEIFGES
ncbi:TlpA disulfide reductase family protein [Fulvivirga sp.]|uniref:TlpA disulfide reductase family protein n=1 Tax=Fulvivirga sp. TaxID=1931237 RepID=UPI0032EC8965